MPLYTATVFVWLPHLPNGRLSRSLLPIVVADDTDEVMMLPAIFWQHTAHYQTWLIYEHLIKHQQSLQNSTEDTLTLSITQPLHENVVAYQQLIQREPNIYKHFEELVFPAKDELTLASLTQLLTNSPLPTTQSADEQFLTQCYTEMKQKRKRWHEVQQLEPDLLIQACMQKMQNHEPIMEGFSVQVQRCAKLRLFNWQPLLESLIQPLSSKALALNKLPNTAPLPKIATIIYQHSLSHAQAQKLIRHLKNVGDPSTASVQKNSPVKNEAWRNHNTTALLYLGYLYLIGKFTPQFIGEGLRKLSFASNLGDYRASYTLAELMLAIPELTETIISPEIAKDGLKFYLYCMKKSSTEKPSLSIFETQLKSYLNHPQTQLEQVRNYLSLASQQGHPTAQEKLQSLIDDGILPANRQQPFSNFHFWLSDYVDNMQNNQSTLSATPPPSLTERFNTNRPATPKKNLSNPSLFGWLIKIMLALGVIIVIKSCFFTQEKTQTIAQPTKNITPTAVITTAPSKNTAKPITQPEITPPLTLYRAVSSIANKIPYQSPFSSNLTLMQIGHNASQEPDIVTLVFMDTSGAIMSTQSAQALYCKDHLFEPLRQLKAPIKLKIKSPNLATYEIRIKQCT